MRSYNIGSGFMIGILLLFTAIVAARMIYLGAKKKSKVEFRNYIKTYKYGKFLWVYLLAIPLFAMSYHYEGVGGFDCFFKAFTTASKLLGLQFDLSLGLTKVNQVYDVAVKLCYCIAILNLVLFVVSCLGQIIWNGWARLRFLNSNTDKCLILGKGHNNELFYKSIKHKHGLKTKRIVADIMNKEDKWDLYTKSVHYHGSTSTDDLQKYIIKLLDKFDKKFIKVTKKAKDGKKVKPFPKFQIIINFENNTKNANMCTFLSNLIGTYAIKNKKDINEVNNYLPYLDVYIYTDNKSMSLYSNLNTEFSGCLHLVNEQEVIAIDFIEKYPLAKYLLNTQIDYKTSLLKNNTKISVSFVGFGKTQQQIFKLLYSHSQFVKKSGKQIVGEKVLYNIYDKTNTWDNPEFRDTFNRYKNEFLKKYSANKYYPLAPMTEPIFNKIDITSPEFAEASAKLLEKHKQGNNLKYVVISLGNDFASIDYANKLWVKIKQDRIRNVHLFVKINDKDSFNNISHIFSSRNEAELHSSCNVYGCLDDTAYSYESVVMNDMTDLAIMADALYNAATNTDPKLAKLDLKANLVEKARNNWTYVNEFNRYSSLCAVLNLRSKLLCMGLDYVKESDKNKKELFATYKDYWNRLDKDFLPKLADGKNNGTDYLKFEWDTSYYFNTNSRRWALITLEHDRWDAFERCKGVIPLAKSIVKEKGVYKNKATGFNACMTTMNGLQMLQDDLIAHELKGKKNKKLSLKKKATFDKIQLDGLNLDAAWHILKKIGYKIVAKE